MPRPHDESLENRNKKKFNKKMVIIPTAVLVGAGLLAGGAYLLGGQNNLNIQEPNSPIPSVENYESNPSITPDTSSNSAFESSNSSVESNITESADSNSNEVVDENLAPVPSPDIKDYIPTNEVINSINNTIKGIYNDIHTSFPARTLYTVDIDVNNMDVTVIADNLLKQMTFTDTKDTSRLEYLLSYNLAEFDEDQLIDINTELKNTFSSENYDYTYNVNVSSADMNEIASDKLSTGIENTNSSLLYYVDNDAVLKLKVMAEKNVDGSAVQFVSDVEVAVSDTNLHSLSRKAVEKYIQEQIDDYLNNQDSVFNTMEFNETNQAFYDNFQKLNPVNTVSNTMTENSAYNIETKEAESTTMSENEYQAMQEKNIQRRIQEDIDEYLNGR